MKSLGIDVEVWVGWTPDHLVIRTAPGSGRCTRGVIVDGPYPAGQMFEISGEKLIATEQTWAVMIYGDSVETLTAEGLLTPIDDDGEPLDTDELLPRDIEPITR
jgi:hypothetical protein